MADRQIDRPGNAKGGPAWLVWNQLYDNWQFFVLFCFQNRLTQISQTGGQWYSDNSPFSIPWIDGQKHGITDRQIDNKHKQTDRKKYRSTDRQANKQSQTGRQKSKYSLTETWKLGSTDRQIINHKQTNRQKYRSTDRRTEEQIQTDGQTEEWMHRQAGRLTDRWTKA